MKVENIVRIVLLVVFIMAIAVMVLFGEEILNWLMAYLTRSMESQLDQLLR